MQSGVNPTGCSATIQVGQPITLPTGAYGQITYGTVTALGTGTGGAGTYTLSQSSTVSSTTLYALGQINFLSISTTDGFYDLTATGGITAVGHASTFRSVTATTNPSAFSAGTTIGGITTTGSGTGITTGPTSSTSGNCVQFANTSGAISDSGAPCGGASAGLEYALQSSNGSGGFIDSGCTAGDGTGIHCSAFHAAPGRIGTFTCTAGGTITVANTNETTTSMVTFSLNTAGGTITATPYMKTVTAGTGFTVGCSAGDTSVWNYTIWN